MTWNYLTSIAEVIIGLYLFLFFFWQWIKKLINWNNFSPSRVFTKCATCLLVLRLFPRETLHTGTSSSSTVWKAAAWSTTLDQSEQSENSQDRRFFIFRLLSLFVQFVIHVKFGFTYLLWLLLQLFCFLSIKKVVFFHCCHNGSKDLGLNKNFDSSFSNNVPFCIPIKLAWYCYFASKTHTKVEFKLIWFDSGKVKGILGGVAWEIITHLGHTVAYRLNREQRKKKE